LKSVLEFLEDWILRSLQLLQAFIAICQLQSGQ
jgi:hypothetical protein